MKIIYLPRPIDGTRYTKYDPKHPRLPLDICLKPFVELDDGVSVEGPFDTSDEAHNYMREVRNFQVID